MDGHPVADASIGLQDRAVGSAQNFLYLVSAPAPTRAFPLRIDLRAGSCAGARFVKGSEFIHSAGCWHLPVGAGVLAEFVIGETQCPTCAV